MSESPDPFKAVSESARSGQRFSRGIMDSAQQIWLAGLGALSRTQQEGGKFFDALVEEGVRIQEKTHTYSEEQARQTRAQTEAATEDARKRSTAAMGRLEQVFDTQVERAFKRLHIPSQRDIEDLSARIDALAGEVRAAQAAPRKTTTRKSGAGQTSPHSGSKEV